MALLHQHPPPLSTSLLPSGLTLSSSPCARRGGPERRPPGQGSSSSSSSRRKRRGCRLLAELRAWCKEEEGKGLGRRSLAALLATSAHMLLLNRDGPSAAIPSTDLKQLSLGILEERQVKKSTEQKEGDSIGIYFLNSLAVVGAGILGILYFSERQAKAASDLSLKDATFRLKAREDAMLSLKEKLEGDLFAEKERALKQLKNAQEERTALLDELTFTKVALDDLQKQLYIEKNMVQKLEENIKGLRIATEEAEEQSSRLKEKLDTEQGKGQVLENDLRKANDLMKSKEQEIACLQSILDGKEKTSEELKSQVHETTGKLSQAKSKMQMLEKEVSTLNNSHREKETVIKDLNAELVIAMAQGKETEMRMTTIHRELESVKVLSEKQLEEAKNSLSLKVAEVKGLELKLAEASEETEKKNKIICNLHEEIYGLKHKLSEENSTIEHLTVELNSSSEKVESLKAHVASLSQELETSRELKKKLDQRVADLQMESDANISSLNEALNQERKTSSQIKNELEVVQRELDNLEVEATSLNNRNEELEALCKQLQEELLSSQESAKAAIVALEEQKVLTSSTKKQLELARRAITEAKENIKLLRKDVVKARTELENVNKEVSSLTEKLETANGKVVRLEVEKALIIESLDEERKHNNDLKEKASQVDLALEKFNKEKETSTKRVKKLEVDLASAKGEMLRLKKQATTIDSALEEAKSRVQTVAQNTQLVDATEITSDMEILKSELSAMQVSLEHIEICQAEAELAVEAVQDAANQSQSNGVAVVSSAGRQGANN